MSVRLSKKTGAALLLVSSALVSLVLAGWAFVPRDSSPTKPAAGAEQVIVLNRQQLERLSWQDVAIGRFSWNSEAETQATDLLGLSAEIENDPTQYLRGLLLIAASRSSEALQVFDKINPDKIPTEQLYAPFRLHDALRPREANPYLDRLLSRADWDARSTLLKARVLVRMGRFKQAIQAYLSSDPKQWTKYDAIGMRQISAHSGLEIEVSRMVSAAITGGRIPHAVRTQFTRLLFTGNGDSAARRLRDQFAERLRSTPDNGKLAMDSFREIQSHRMLFLDQGYRRLIELHRATDPEDMTSELVAMLFLSALSEQERDLAASWGQEIKRRHPHPEAKEWVENLIRSAFQAS